MAISTSFFLVYSAQKIKTEKLEKKPVSIRAQVRYTRSAMAWSIAKRMGHQVERLQFLKDQNTPPKPIENQRRICAILLRFQTETGYQINYNSINRTFAARFITWAANTLPKRRSGQNIRITAERYITDLKHFLNHAHREEWTTATTWRQIKSTRQPRKFPITITDDEIQQLAIEDFTLF